MLKEAKTLPNGTPSRNPDRATPMTTRVVIAGGGVGGVVAANELRTKLKSKAELTLIDRKSRFEFPPSFPWVVMGTRSPDQVQKDLAVLGGRGIRVLRDEVGGIDVSQKIVRTTGEEVPYDFLVVALGAEYAPESIPGFSDYVFHMYDLAGAIRLRDAVASFSEGTVAVGVARLPFKCPAAPYEMAFLLDDTFRRRGVRDKIRIELFTPEGAPLPAAGPETGGQVLTMLRERGIDFYPKHKLREVSPNLVSFEEGAPRAFDLLICVPPHRAPKPVVDAGLTDESGWVPVDAGTLTTKQADVFAVGDVTAISTPNGYVPFLPKAGSFARGQAEVVAHNLSVRILRKGRPKVWDGYGACFLEVERTKSAFVSGNFMAAPRPQLQLRPPRAIYHTQKVLFEKYWMRHWF